MYICTVKYGSILNTVLDNREMYIIRCDDMY